MLEIAQPEEYLEFLKKFELKKTTDDCLTPVAVYDAVLNWVKSEYKPINARFIRPFYPSGDYEKFKYQDNDIVVDNPPFSIFAQIIRFYLANNVKFFLFAPHLTLFSSNLDVTHIVTAVSVIYDNKARVNTSFVTNLDDDEIKIRTAPKLKQAIAEANWSTYKPKAKYDYPKNLVSAALLDKLSYADYSIKKSECSPLVRVLDSQRPLKKSIFGAGFLISDEKTLERLKAEAESEKIRGSLKEKAGTLDAVWELSERELEIIKNLNNKAK